MRGIIITNHNDLFLINRAIISFDKILTSNGRFLDYTLSILKEGKIDLTISQARISVLYSFFFPTINPGNLSIGRLWSPVTKGYEAILQD